MTSELDFELTERGPLAKNALKPTGASAGASGPAA